MQGVIGVGDDKVRVWLKDRLLGESLDSQQGLALKLITTFCPADTHTHIFSHSHVALLRALRREPCKKKNGQQFIVY